jgi:transcriptional regulator with XRE-family HTH domain
MTKKSVKNKIKARREGQGLTQRQLAIAAGIDQTYVSTLECNDDVAPRIDTLARIAAALDCGIEQLVPDRLKRTARAS